MFSLVQTDIHLSHLCGGYDGLLAEYLAASLDAPTAERLAQTVNRIKGQVTIAMGSESISTHVAGEEN